MTSQTEDEILSPDCPLCGEPPTMALSLKQAFCDNPACATLTWDMTKDPHWLTANANQIPFPDLP